MRIVLLKNPSGRVRRLSQEGRDVRSLQPWNYSSLMMRKDWIEWQPWNQNNRMLLTTQNCLEIIHPGFPPGLDL